MSLGDEGRAYMREAGMSDTDIALMTATVDQGEAWVKEAVALGVVLRRAALAGDWARADQMGRRITAMCHEIGLTDPTHQAVVNVLITHLAQMALEKYLVGDAQS